MIIRKEKETIGSRIKKIRIKNNLTRRELSNLTNIVEISLYVYENGLKDPNINQIKRIAISLNVTTDYILGRIDEKTNEIIILNRILNN